jgi:hypothetical protein
VNPPSLQRVSIDACPVVDLIGQQVPAAVHRRLACLSRSLPAPGPKSAPPTSPTSILADPSRRAAFFIDDQVMHEQTGEERESMIQFRPRVRRRTFQRAVTITVAASLVSATRFRRAAQTLFNLVYEIQP